MSQLLTCAHVKDPTNAPPPTATCCEARSLAPPVMLRRPAVRLPSTYMITWVSWTGCRETHIIGPLVTVGEISTAHDFISSSVHLIPAVHNPPASPAWLQEKHMEKHVGNHGFYMPFILQEWWRPVALNHNDAIFSGFYKIAKSGLSIPCSNTVVMLLGKYNNSLAWIVRP